MRDSQPHLIPPTNERSNFYYTPPERGVWMTTWLVVSAVGVALSLLGSCGLLVGAGNSRGVSAGFIPQLVIGSVVAAAHLYFLWQVWNWKRRGIFGLAVICLINLINVFVFNLVTLINVTAPLVYMAIWYFLVENAWDRFE